MSSTAGVRTVIEGRASEMFFDHLCRSRERVLLLGYDGTIAPFSRNRQQAVPYPAMPELLNSIMSTCNTRVVFITGRSAREIPPLLGIHPHPEIWGCYGTERLSAEGDYDLYQISEDALRALSQADLWLARERLDGLVELKASAVAVHWRGLNPTHVEEVKAAAYRALSSFVGASLMLAEFDGGLELRLRKHSKGQVVQELLAQHASDAAFAYLGDDTSDEDAFRVLNGRGLSVLVRPTYRFTAAREWLRPPRELANFLTHWVVACGGEI